MKFGCKYIETSPGINHNVDELLVGMLAQIQLRQDRQDELAAKRRDSGKEAAATAAGGGGFKMMDLLEKVWKMSNNKSKSCGNLHVL